MIYKKEKKKKSKDGRNSRSKSFGGYNVVLLLMISGKPILNQTIFNVI